VQVYVSPGGPETEPPGSTTGAYIREYSLLEFADPSGKDR
jgi:hypothetical protein